MPPKMKVDVKKLEAERLTALLQELLREEENKYCSECESKQPRWASWNLGVFLCIRCAGLHRNLGVHISKVKSVNLDSWTAEQVQSMRVMGNAKAKAVYESELPQMFRRPQSDQSLEAFIRAKYESKRYIMKDWIPPPVNVADCFSERSAGNQSENSLPHHHRGVDERAAEKRKSGTHSSIPKAPNHSPKGGGQTPNIMGVQAETSPAVLVDLFDSPVHSSNAPSVINFQTETPSHQNDNLDDLFGPIVSANSGTAAPAQLASPTNGMQQQAMCFAQFPPSGVHEPVPAQPFAQPSTCLPLVGSTSADANLFAMGGGEAAKLEGVNFEPQFSSQDNKKSNVDIMALFGSGGTRTTAPPPSHSLSAFHLNNQPQQQHSAPTQFPAPSNMSNQVPFHLQQQQHQQAGGVPAMGLNNAPAAPAAMAGLDDLFGQFKM